MFVFFLVAVVVELSGIVESSKVVVLSEVELSVEYAKF